MPALPASCCTNPKSITFAKRNRGGCSDPVLLPGYKHASCPEIRFSMLIRVYRFVKEIQI